MSLPAGGQDISVTADVAITAAYIGKVTTTGDLTADIAGDNETADGVYQLDADSGAQASLRTSGYTYVIVVDATASVGDFMKSDSSGKATVCNTDGDHTIVKLMKAVTAGNQIVRAEICKKDFWVTAG